MSLTIDEILSQSPYLDGYDENKIQMAFYSIGCCWWTSFPDDLGATPPVSNKDGKISIDKKNGHSFPCCPHCSALLMQAPLVDFIKAAQGNPENYGKHGIETFIISHERNSKTCFTSWTGYNLFIDPFGLKGK